MRTDLNVTANITVTANFEIDTFTLTYTAGAGGTIEGTSPQTVNFGSDGTLVTAVPNTGYHFVDWSDGVLTAARTDLDVRANLSVTANFAIDTFTLTYTAGAGGTIEGTSPQTVNYSADDFHSGGKANTLSGDGTLSPAAPKKEPPDRYDYDPADPTPFVMRASSAQVGGPDDYKAVGERKDVLVYTTPPLEQDMEPTGPLSVKLDASSSAPDTDWRATPMDVYPDGDGLRLYDGVIRASFRNRSRALPH